MIKTIQLTAYAVSLDYYQGRYLAGTRDGKISVIDEKSDEVKEIMQGHSHGETWGLSVGKDGSVYTTADDNKIISFNPKSKKTNGTGVVN